MSVHQQNEGFLANVEDMGNVTVQKLDWKAHR